MNKKRMVFVRAHNAYDFYSSHNGVIEADREIAEALSILCSKGYVTVASCAGHPRFKKGYIWFKDGTPSRIPRGTYMCRGITGSLRWRPNTIKGLKRVHNTLLRWAKILSIKKGG